MPALRLLDQAALGLLAERSVEIALRAGDKIFEPGHPPLHYLILLEGVVRVQQASEGGREIVLYRISAGESCSLTTVCLLSRENYSAEAVVEQPGRAVAVPRETFDHCLERSKPFRQFAFQGFGNRITSLFRLLEDVAFTRVDVRLAEKLLSLADGDGEIRATHQQLASELGSAREVITRHLQAFQRKGWVNLARGKITITHRAALAACLHETPGECD